MPVPPPMEGHTQCHWRDLRFGFFGPVGKHGIAQAFRARVPHPRPHLPTCTHALYKTQPRGHPMLPGLKPSSLPGWWHTIILGNAQLPHACNLPGLPKDRDLLVPILHSIIPKTKCPCWVLPQAPMPTPGTQALTEPFHYGGTRTPRYPRAYLCTSAFIPTRFGSPRTPTLHTVPTPHLTRITRYLPHCLPCILII